MLALIRAPKNIILFKITLCIFLLITSMFNIYAQRSENLQTLSHNLGHLSLNLCKTSLNIIMKKLVSRPHFRIVNYEERRHKAKAELEQEFAPRYLMFKANDNTNLSAFLIERQNAKYIIFIHHGYGSAKERMLPWIKLFPNETLFVLDSRAHGDSEGDTITFGYKESKDVKSALHYLAQNPSTKRLPVIGLGISMGSMILLKAAHEGALFKGLIVDSPLLNIHSLTCNLTHTYKLSFCPCYLAEEAFEQALSISLDDNLNALSFIHNLSIPIFIIHSTGDVVLPYTLAEDAYKKLPSTKNLWIIANNTIGHVEIIYRLKNEYKKRVTAFLSTL